jgi:hypothetical protein
MPYFFILPAFVLYVLAMSAAIFVTLLYRPVAGLRRHVSAALIWSCLGFVVSTVIYVLVLLGTLSVVEWAVGGKPSVIGGVVMGGMLFIAPFVAAASGVVGGAVFGLWRTLKKS